jgi:hypothetical protein
MNIEQEVLKIAGVENYKYIWKTFYDEGKVFIFKYKRVFKLEHSDSKGYFAKEIKELRKDKDNSISPYTLRGRYVAFNYKNALDLTGGQLKNN